MPAHESLPRVAWVADAAWPPRSGIGNNAFQLIGSLARRGVPVTLVHRGRRAPLLCEPLPEAVLPGWTGRRILRRLVPPLLPACRRFDLVHFPTEFDLWYLRPGRAARVVTVHGCAAAVLPESVHHRLSAGLVRRLSRRLGEVEAVVTVSEASATEIEAVYGVPRARLEVIPNGVGGAFHAAKTPDAGWLLDRFGINRPYLLAVGLMIPKKNLHAALGILARMASGGLPHLLVHAGESGPGEADLRSAAAGLGVADRLRPLGFVGEEELANLYAGAAALLFPSLHEGFGIPVAEAMAAGCPVVASDIPSLREVTGGLVPLFRPDDVEGMAGEVRRLLGDEGYRADLVARSREWAARYSWDRSAGLLLDLYRKILGESHR